MSQQQGNDMAASNRKPSTVSESAPSDQVDTLRERLAAIFKEQWPEIEALNGFSNTKRAIESVCQGVAKEAEEKLLDKLLIKFYQPHTTTNIYPDEHQPHDEAAVDIRDMLAELTGNRNGQLASSETPTADTNKADNRCAVCSGQGRISTAPDWDWETCFKCHGTGSDPSEVA